MYRNWVERPLTLFGTCMLFWRINDSLEGVSMTLRRGQNAEDSKG